MKTLLSILSIVALFSFASCGNNSNSNETVEKKNDSASQSVSPGTTETQKMGSVSDVVVAYLKLKNALTSDNGNEGAAAANEINTALSNVNESAFTPEQKKTYDELKDDIKEHAEHISANGSNIDHQREHFDLLSKDMIDLVKSAGSSQGLFIDFCPMYNNKKGASWLSETKEIKNPYYGNEMLKCGVVKEEIKAKA